jgi:Na+/H+ antiporter NhaD/arsenite permease-like protein
VSPTLLPALILAATYAVPAVGQAPGLRIDRTAAAIVGAILMVTIGGLLLDKANQSIDYRTLVLLFGMMVLAANLQLAQCFTRLS